MKKTISLYFKGNETEDTVMVIEEFIEYYGSDFKEKILATTAQELKYRDRLNLALAKETDSKKKVEIRQKHTNIKHDLKCYVLALGKVYKRENITLELIESMWSDSYRKNGTAKQKKNVIVDKALVTLSKYQRN